LGVARIRRFYKEHDLSDEVSTNALALHSIAFGLYLVTELGSVILESLVAIWPFDSTLRTVYVSFLFVYYTGNFVSQALLCVIFWDLGTK
jgi:hypothetical protein